MNLADAIQKAEGAAVAVPADDLATLIVTGSDRQTWLNGLVTCDVAPMKEGEATYGLFTTQKGRVLSDVIVLLDGDRLLLAVPRAPLGELRAALDHYLIMEDVEVTVGEMAVTLVHGPKANDVLQAMVAAGARGAALDRTGLGGAVVFADAGLVTAVDAARDAALTTVGGGVADDAAWDALRIARRVPRFGADFDAATYPQEAGLEKRAVSFSKGCYLGQEVVCMLEMRGHVKRRLVALRLEGAAPARGADVTDETGESVGAITSSAAGDGGAVALAMVKRGKAESGTALRVGETRATVVDAAS